MNPNAFKKVGLTFDRDEYEIKFEMISVNIVREYLELEFK